MLLSTATHRKYAYTLLAAVVIVVLLSGNYAYNGHISREYLIPSRYNLMLIYEIANTTPQKPKPTAATASKPEPFPHKIWQSWKDDSEDPTERTVGFPHQWRVVNPGWRYERITDANNDVYVLDRFDANISDVFTSLKDPILKADFLRYLILLREGGVWADIDVYPHQPVSKWIPKQYQGSVNLVIGIENDHHKKPIWPGSPYSVQLCQYSVLAKPNHPAIKTVVEQVTGDLKKLFASKKPGEGVSFEEVMSTTGPFAFTKVLMDYFKEMTGTEHTGDELDSLSEPRLIGDVLVLPKDSFGWLPHENTHEKGDPSILVEHLFIGSWRDSHHG
jgi:mannosyltransferase OCH1-like enzyme